LYVKTACKILLTSHVKASNYMLIGLILTLFSYILICFFKKTSFDVMNSYCLVWLKLYILSTKQLHHFSGPLRRGSSSGLRTQFVVVHAAVGAQGSRRLRRCRLLRRRLQRVRLSRHFHCGSTGTVRRGRSKKVCVFLDDSSIPRATIT